MRVLHLTCVRELSSGQRKQLTYEYNVKNELNIDWDVVILHSKQVQDKRFEIQIPKFFRGLFLRNLFAWIYLLKVQKKYDVIINRHMTFDPFVLIFGWIINNRITVHHAKEVEELKLIRKGWKGKIASIFEKISGFINSKQIRASICVTTDIANYQKKLFFNKTFLYPNGIDLKLTGLLEDKRDNNSINIVFMCGTFSSWHGLDLLLESITSNINFIIKNNVKIHLIGKVLENELNIIHKNKLENYVVLYGLLPTEEYQEILKNCDIGLDSLALSRKNLEEAAALKVREYLANGLPVFSAYKDTAIPKDFEYYKISSPDVKEMISFAETMKSISRKEVRKKSEQFISKKVLLRNIYNQLKIFVNDK